MPAPQIFEAMSGETDFARRAWIEAPAPGRRQVQEVRNGRGTVLVNRHGTGLDLTVDMLEPGWVVVSQTAWRGWRRLSGGEELPLAFANLAYLASTSMPAGTRSSSATARCRSSSAVPSRSRPRPRS